MNRNPSEFNTGMDLKKTNIPPRLVVAVGEKATDDSERMWIDPTKLSSLVHEGDPEHVVATFRVVKTMQNKDGSTTVAYVDGNRNIIEAIIPEDRTDKFRDAFITRTVRGDDGAAIDLQFAPIPNYDNNVDQLILGVKENVDGSLLVQAIYGPNIHVRSIDGANDKVKGPYVLNGSTLQLIKPADRTSLFEEIASGGSNFGITLTGGDHGGNFLPVEGKPGRDGRPLSNQHAGDIPVAARK